ncbi:Spectrin beta chain, non-erythrocytic 1 [Liparis tanakae]|uniref:Spectrin beta chain, non-erythrocytic 1 n=1 Tax=Liparis tanakae TaxID=230148 RepID=A0A4Z2GT86_9TELE|nr:Spectrin beta chain, non-erythrocytic 1 [Liparis tanakae]
MLNDTQNPPRGRHLPSRRPLAALAAAMTSATSTTDFDNAEITQQYSRINTRFGLTDLEDMDNDNCSARLFERSRIRALAECPASDRWGQLPPRPSASPRLRAPPVERRLLESHSSDVTTERERRVEGRERRQHVDTLKHLVCMDGATESTLEENRQAAGERRHGSIVTEERGRKEEGRREGGRERE